MNRMAVALLSLLFACLAGCSAPDSGAAAAPDAESFRALGIRYSFTPPLDGVFCSGQSTPEQFAQLSAAGVRRVISLRAPGEEGTGFEEEQAAALGIEFVRMPIDGKQDITVEKARQLGELMAAGSKPVLVACGSSNRVGALLAMKAHFIDGVPADRALELGRECGMTRLEATVKQAFEAGR